ncbi:hypothetical protein JCM11641_007778 [Rhodosporidiobolus odoratus]
MQYTQPLSPNKFAFPHRPSSSASRPSHPLAPAFNLPPRGASLARHQPNLSAISTASSSTSSSSAARSTSSLEAHHPSLSAARSTSSLEAHHPSFSRRVSAASTDCTSEFYDDDCYDYDEDNASVLEDLYGLMGGRIGESRAGPGRLDALLEEEPPRVASPTDSSLLLRERTRYRSSASYAPAVGSAHPPPSSSSPASPRARQAPPHQYASLLASLSLNTLDKCFCGKDPEEDSIYCSRICARADALNALCAGSSGAEDSSDAASLQSGSADSSGRPSSGGETHYRRVEQEEARKEQERQARLSKDRREAKRNAARSSGDSGKKVQGSLWRNNVKVASLRVGSGETQQASTSYVPTPGLAPPPRTSSRRTPSLTSSVSSLSTGVSSAVPSPLSPAFPPNAHATSPFIVEPPSPLDASFTPHSPPFRPCTPNPPSHLAPSDVGDIHAPYLTATPLANEKLRTPTQVPTSASSSPSTLTPRGRTNGTTPEDDSPTQRGASASLVGRSVLDMCIEYDEAELVAAESRDRVTEEGGWGAAQQMHERMQRRAPRSGSAHGHQKGKLSFEDVVGILGA